LTEPFQFPVRVYYEDTDAAGVVYYANYLKFMERARTEWLAALGFPLAAFERDHGVVFAVHRCEIDFRRPGRLNDDLMVTVEDVRCGASRLVARQEVRRVNAVHPREGSPQARIAPPFGAAMPGAREAGAGVLTSARVTLACLDAARWRPVRMPRPLVQRLETD
jgi:acyl-CoA thioester hydrolase